MENLWLRLKSDIATAVGAETNDIGESEKFGDFAYACFAKAKEMKKSPVEVAKELSQKLKINIIEKIEATGPYVNFYIDWKEFSKILLNSVDEKYGSSEDSETVIMDVFQANPFKSFHIGHIKNAATGESMRRIFEKMGKKTITVNYNGDVGIHVARWLLYYKKFYKGELPKVNFTKFSGEIYAKASQMAKDDPKFEEEAQELNRKIDKRDSSIVDDWKHIRDLCYQDYEKIRKELDVKVDSVVPESECEEPGKAKVMQFFKEGKLVESEGAIGIDLEKYGLGFFLLLKSDGTAIYASKDIGLLQRKKEKYKFDKMVYVVGSEQNLYFQQLFRAFDILGLYPLERSKHISHGLVTLKEGKMSSRLGNTISYEDLRDIMKKRVLESIEAKNPDIMNKEEIALKVALGAMKFQMLDMENNKTIKFDWEESLDFEGKSGPYLQYSYVRAFNILNKAVMKDCDTSLLKEEIELNLIKKVAKFPDVIRQACEQYSPNLISNYIFELAQEFNSFYHNSPVLKAEEGLKSARLKLVNSIMIVLGIGLELLGIPVLEEM
jgi:arginyl-tRNA synthetase